jgi:hypothetical protein
VVAGYLVGRFVNARFGRMAVIGGVLAPVEQVIKGANIPILSPALGDYYVLEGFAPDSGGTSAVLGVGGYAPDPEQELSGEDLDITATVLPA